MPVVLIKEIPFPLPGVHRSLTKRPDENAGRRGRPKGRGKKKKKGYDYILFERDPSLVIEFAKTCGIDEALAKDILTVFFDEIKKMLLDGNIVTFSNFGKFYIGASNLQKGEIRSEIDAKHVVPKFRASDGLKKLLNKICA